MERQMYYDFARSLKGKLIEEVNGYVKTEIYPDIDTIIVKFTFKEFEFSYPINEIADIIYSGSSDILVDNIIEKYKKAIMRGFFKTKGKKEQEQLVEIL